MPRKSKTKYRVQRGSEDVFTVNNLGDAQIFRNSFAVFDGADPQISLKYMKDMFKDKLDEDVITMIFSECAYDVDQALETLIALANNEDDVLRVGNTTADNLSPLEDSKNLNFSEDSQQSSNLDMKHLSNHLSRKHLFKAGQNICDYEKLGFGSSHFNEENFDDNPYLNKSMYKGGVEDCTDSMHAGNGDCRDSNMFPDAAQSTESVTYKQNQYHGFPSSYDANRHQNIFLPDTHSKSMNSFNNFRNPRFVTPFMPVSHRLQLYSSPMGYRPIDFPHGATPIYSEPRMRQFHSTQPPPNWSYDSAHKSIIEKITSGQKLLIILRGLPGSGKSTLAYKLKFSGVVYSTDDFFYKRGVYVFNGRKLNEAHEWNQLRTKKALERRISPVIIDNTNLVAWEFAPYVQLGLQHEYEIHILEPNTPWKFDSKELARRNRHGVTKESIDRMLNKYQLDVTVETIVKSILDNENPDLQEVDNRLSEQTVSFAVGGSSCKSDADVKNTCQSLKLNDINQNMDDHEGSKSTPTLKFSGDSDDCLNNSSFVSHEKYVKLEAIVHQEDTIENCEVNPEYNTVVEEVTLNTSIANSNTNGESANNKTLIDTKVFDLIELRALTQGDSEESQSLSVHTSTSDSNQDVSCWEAITEHDDDFLWSTVPSQPINSYNLEKSSKENKIKFSENEAVDFESSKDINDDRSTEVISKKISQEENINNFLSNIQSRPLNVSSMDENNDEISFDTQTNSIIDKFDSKSKTNMSLADTAKIKLANELFSSILSMKSSSDNVNSPTEESYLYMNEDVDTWDEKINFNEEKSDIISSNCIITNETQNLSKLFNNQCDIFKSPVDSKDETKIELNSKSPKPQRTRKPSTDLLQKLFDLKPAESSKKVLENVVWEPNVYDSSWNVPNNNESSLFKKSNSKIESKLEIVKVNEYINGENSEASNIVHIEQHEHSLTESVEIDVKPNEGNFRDSNYVQIKGNELGSKQLGRVNQKNNEENSGDFNSVCNEQNENSFNEISEKQATSPLISNSGKKVTKKKSSAELRCLFRNSLENLTNDWQFPEYMLPVNETIKESVTKKVLNCVNEIETQTDPYDFVLLHQVETKENLTIDFEVLTSRISTKVPNLSDCEYQIFNQKDLHKTPAFEKGTSTDDLPYDIEISQKFLNLHKCFPDIADEDLNHLLEICHGNDNWLSNLLLEWGYKYNVHYVEDTQPETKTVWQSDTLVSKTPITFKNLFSKSHEIIPEIVVNDDKLNELKNTESLTNDSFSATLIEEESNNQLSSIAAPSIADSRDISKLHLSLNSAFALQLEELFGPVDDTSSAPTIEISLKFAKKIHKRWRETINRNAKSADISETEKKVAGKATHSSDFQFQVSVKNESSINLEERKEPLPLSEIMDMEYALELHKKEKIKRDTNLGSFAKLQRQELYSLFPGADTLALDEIFESNNYSLKDSIKALGEDLAYPKPLIRINGMNEKEENILQMNKPESDILLDFINDDWSSWVCNIDNNDVDGGNNTATYDFDTISPEATQLREEAMVHFNLRQESVQKAQQAYCKGMKDVASYYAQKGNIHGSKFKELNKKASALIIQQRNVTTDNLAIDLHGLFIQEAIPSLERFLKDKKLELKRRQMNCPLTLSIITGQGIHSERGARLRPSVTEFLKKAGYRYSEVNKGLIQVTLIPDHLT